MGRSRDLWDQATELFATPVERVRIPYGDLGLEGYLFHPDASGSPTPTLILNNRSDGPVNAMWSQGGAAAIDRGWRALAFDGPGQGVALHRHSLPFRHDWEAVITPVVDFLQQREDVDHDRIMLHGISQAGYWVPAPRRSSTASPRWWPTPAWSMSRPPGRRTFPPR